MTAREPFPDAVRDYLDEVIIPLRLGVRTTSGWPLVVSLWFIHLDGSLYCATQSSALVAQYLAADNRCGFEVAADDPPYCGVRGRARAQVLPARGVEILQLLLQRYLGGLDSPLAARLLANSEGEVALRLEPVSWSTWNFSARMAESSSGSAPKPCPPAQA